jgi:hypothetical protein
MPSAPGDSIERRHQVGRGQHPLPQIILIAVNDLLGTRRPVTTL